MRRASDPPACLRPHGPRSRRSALTIARTGALIIALLIGLGAAAAQEGPREVQGPAPLVGYVEGRIVDIVERDGAPGRALVLLRDGRVVDAELPLDDPYSTFRLPEFRVGERVELYYWSAVDGRPSYVVTDWVRRPALLALVGLFAVVAFAVARFKGLRAFLSTAASLTIVLTFIVPRILDGWNPITVSLIGVGGILLLAIYFVHGLNWSTTAALVGTFMAVILTMVLGIAFTDLANLTGLGNDEAMFIISAAPQVALKGLLLAGLLIGALGALTDITIVQASVVRELAHTDPTLGARELYGRAMNVGRDHIGSLVNTLVLAYTGAGLSLLILLNVNEFGFERALNLELVASEVVHTLVGSIGLILAVPITTLLAALLFRGDRLPIRSGELTHAHHH